MSERGPYELVIKGDARKELLDLPTSVSARAQAALDRLMVYLNEGGPAPDITAMRGSDHEYRIRIGDYRIVYRRDDGTRTIIVFRVAHRREVFRRR